MVVKANLTDESSISSLVLKDFTFLFKIRRLVRTSQKFTSVQKDRQWHKCVNNNYTNYCRHFSRACTAQDPVAGALTPCGRKYPGNTQCLTNSRTQKKNKKQEDIKKYEEILFGKKKKNSDWNSTSCTKIELASPKSSKYNFQPAFRFMNVARIRSYNLRETKCSNSSEK